MSNSSNEQTAESFFGNVISTYTRTQAIEDGVLIDASAMAQEAGFKWPVALTSAVWADCVAWSEDDNHQLAYQDGYGTCSSVRPTPSEPPQVPAIGCCSSSIG